MKPKSKRRKTFTLKKKKILLILLVLFSAYIIWLSTLLLRFKTYKAPLSNASSLDVQGVYHIHTTFSDGRKDLDHIANLAARAQLDFIIITDHGSPNYKSLASEGWKEGILVLAGSELSISRGHLVGLGFKPPSWYFSQNAEMAVYEIKDQGGFSIIAHPYSRVPWSWGKFIDYSGIEIISAYSLLKKKLIVSLPFLPTLLLKPEYTLLKTLERPHKNLRKWDDLNRIHPIYGYFSTDAHLLYGPLFKFLHLHLLLETPLSEDFETAKQQVYNALRKGRFYNAVSAAAEAEGFRFWGEKRKEIIPMGDSVLPDSPVTLHVKVPFPFAKETSLLLNGKIIFRSSEKSMSYEVREPGTYRIESYLKERSPLKKDIPWIISNPIFLREEKDEKS